MCNAQLSVDAIHEHVRADRTSSLDRAPAMMAKKAKDSRNLLIKCKLKLKNLHKFATPPSKWANVEHRIWTDINCIAGLVTDLNVLDCIGLDSIGHPPPSH